ncbi:MFS transporter [Sphingomonas oleivorans]|nr:MFS transporter [Sphingomonas oleivorans]
MRLRVKAAYAAPGIGLAGLSLPLLIYLPTFYTAEMGLPLAAVGAAFLIVRLLDIGFDPLVGAAMDRTGSRFGRFRTWFVAGTPLLLLSVYGLFMPPPGTGLIYLAACLVGTYAGWSICFVAQLGWGCTLSDDYAERNSIFAWWQMAYLLGSLIITMLPLLPHLRSDPSLTVPTMGWFILLAVPLGVLTAICGVSERNSTARRAPPPLRDYLRLVVRPGVTRLLAADLLIAMAVFTNGALFFFYFAAARGIGRPDAAMLLFLTNAGALLGAYGWGRLGSRVEKHRAAAIGFGCYAFLLATLHLLPFSGLLAGGAIMALFGATLSAGPVLIRSMLADVGDQERLLSGADHTGLLAALFSNSNKLGAAIGPAISFLLLSLAGFDPRAAMPTDAALSTLTGLAIWAPAMIGFLCAWLILGHRLTASAHAAIRAKLAGAEAAAG